MTKIEFEGKVVSGGRVQIPYDIRLVHNIGKGYRLKIILEKMEDY